MLQRAGGMTDARGKDMRRHSIVIALDLSEFAEIVLEHALDQAARQDAPDLHAVTVVARESEVEEAQRRLAALVLPALEGLAGASWRARLHVRVGVTEEEIVALAGELRADLIVVGRFGLHHEGKRARSLASRVADTADCPTLIVGLSGEGPDAVEQCPDCVAVRAETDGENWFCTAHHGASGHLSGGWIAPTFTGGGPMW